MHLSCIYQVTIAPIGETRGVAEGVGLYQVTITPVGGTAERSDADLYI